MGVRGGESVRLLVFAIAAVVACGWLTGCGASPLTTPASAPSTPEHATLRTLAEAELEPSTLELHEVIAKNEHFTTTAVTYGNGELRVTGALSVPVTDGPHPGLVLVHGVVDPDVYEPGSGLVREQAHFAAAGYVVLSTDLRSSTADMDSAAALGVDLGSTLDVINGVRALHSSRLPTLDEERIALVGHSLGGLLTLNTMVAKPTLIDAAVVLAPASIDPADNVDYLTSKFGGTPTAIVEEYGTPDDNSQFWSAISPRSMVDRVEAPLLIVHGTADEVIPYEWSEQTAAVWDGAGKRVELMPLQGEGHVFQSHWDDAIAMTTAFLEHELSG